MEDPPFLVLVHPAMRRTRKCGTDSLAMPCYGTTSVPCEVDAAHRYFVCDTMCTTFNGAAAKDSQFDTKSPLMRNDIVSKQTAGGISREPTIQCKACASLLYQTLALHYRLHLKFAPQMIESMPIPSRLAAYFHSRQKHCFIINLYFAVFKTGFLEKPLYH